MRIFVTGGAGYIGSVCSELLMDEGHEVTIFDNLIEGHRRALDSRAQFIQGDLADRSKIGAALADYRIFDESLVNLINVGERSGRLADMLKSAAHLAEQKGRDRIKRLMAMLEPVSILVIGCMIGVIVISLFTAITSINNVPL